MTARALVQRHAAFAEAPGSGTPASLAILAHRPMFPSDRAVIEQSAEPGAQEREAISKRSRYCPVSETSDSGSLGRTRFKYCQ